VVATAAQLIRGAQAVSAVKELNSVLHGQFAGRRRQQRNEAADVYDEHDHDPTAAHYMELSDDDDAPSATAGAAGAVRPSGKKRTHKDNVAAAEENLRSRLRGFEECVLLSLPDMAAARAHAAASRVAALQERVRSFPLGSLPACKLHTCPAPAEQQAGASLTVVDGQWQDVQYQSLGAHGKIAIPCLACSACGLSVSFPAVAVGCIPNSPVRPTLWLDLEVRSIYT
jgi:hypothetical protein